MTRRPVAVPDPWPSHGARGEGGSGTVLVALLAVGLVAASLTVGLFGGYLVTAHRARQSSDLAALAAAGSHQSGGNPCASAAAVAARNGARLVSCRLDARIEGFTVSVRTAVAVPVRLPGLPVEATALAHAGVA